MDPQTLHHKLQQQQQQRQEPNSSPSHLPTPTIPPKYTPRASFETLRQEGEAGSYAEQEGRHLLAPSIAPSSSASMISVKTAWDDDENGDDHHHHNNNIEEEREATPRAQSPSQHRQHQQQQQPHPRPYRGFPSEEAYLSALQEFVDSRKYTTSDTMLVGFYGVKTPEEICAQAPPPPLAGLGLTRKWKTRREGRKARAGSEVGGVGGAGSEVGRGRRGTVA